MDHLVSISDQLNEKPSQVFLQQKELEVAWKQASTSIETLQSQMQTWLDTFQSVLNQFKELGSLQTWMENLERQMMIVAHAIQEESRPEL
jgi:hypothetical protein